MLGWIKLPQIASLVLARKDPTNEHNLDHVDKFDPLGYHVLDARLEPSQLVWRTPGQAPLLLGGEPHRDSGSEFGSRQPVSVAWLGDVEPPRLPPFTVSAKEPSGQVTLGILPTIAPLHSAC